MARVRELNEWVMVTRESAEFFLQTEQMGRSFVEWLKLHHADMAEVFKDLPASYPIAFGWAVAAAVKAVPLGQSAGQRILGQIPDAVTRAMALGDDERQAFAPPSGRVVGPP